MARLLERLSSVSYSPDFRKRDNWFRFLSIYSILTHTPISRNEILSNPLFPHVGPIRMTRSSRSEMTTVVFFFCRIFFHTKIISFFSSTIFFLQPRRKSLKFLTTFLDPVKFRTFTVFLLSGSHGAS